MNTPNKILIIRFSSIGDIVLASPLLRVLRTRFPSAQIDFVVRKEYADLIRYNNNINRIYEFDKSAEFGGLRKLKSQIKKERYDLIIDIHNSLRSRYLCLFSRARNIVSINKRIFARTILIKSKKNFYKDIVSIADRYIEPVASLGIQNDRQGLELNIPENVRSDVFSKLTKQGINDGEKIIGLCPSAKHFTKCWPEESYAELGIMLAKEFNAKIVLFGNSDDKGKCISISKAINNFTMSESAIDLSGKLTLLETAAAMDVCEAIVTNDSGLMHIAAARQKKVVTLFGPTVREFGFLPVAKDSIVIERLGLYCRPCSHIGGSKCPEGHLRCMKEINAEEVFQSVKHLLTSGEERT